jgi:AcrR family transcriptional regulator
MEGESAATHRIEGELGDGSTVGDAMNWREFEPDHLAPVLAAALRCFVANGYHGTTTRELAAAGGLSVAGLYHHVGSKHELLVAVMDSAMSDLYRRSLAALAEAGDDPVRQLELHVECLVLFHAHRADLAFVAASEIRSLSDSARKRHIAARDRQQRLLESILAAGTTAGEFAVAKPRDTARALETMYTGVAQWYRAGGAMTPGELADFYVALTKKIALANSMD